MKNDMPNVTAEFMLAVQRERISGASTVHKFGYTDAVGTSLTPISSGGVYRTPLSNATVTLEAVSDDAGDTNGGAGAWELSLNYLDSTGADRWGTITMAGAGSSTTISDVFRLNRAFVSKSGTYADQATPSQLGTITIRETGPGQTWTTLQEVVTGFGSGQSLIGEFSVPAGKRAFIYSQIFSIDSNKTANLYYFKRDNILQTTAPFDAMRLQNIYVGATGVMEIPHRTYENFGPLTDIGFMANVSTGTASIGVEFELLLVDE